MVFLKYDMVLMQTNVRIGRKCNEEASDFYYSSSIKFIAVV